MESDLYTIQSEYFQLCQGEKTSNELYFHIPKANPNDFDLILFNTVFGSLYSSFINKNEIHNLIDLKFNKYNNNNCFFKNFESEGYLKIKCNEPTMLKKHLIPIETKTNLTSGQRYYFSGKNKNSNFTFNINLVKKIIPLKINIFGLDSNNTIDFILNDTIYEINNTPFEINFEYMSYSSNLFKFNIDEEIEDKIFD